MAKSKLHRSVIGEGDNEFLNEIAAILAKGVVRLWTRQKQAGSTPEKGLENLQKTLSSSLPSAEQSVLSVLSGPLTREFHKHGE